MIGPTATASRRLLEQGQLRFSDWTGPNLFGQVLWGSLFCLPFGFSFTALRLSTAVLGLVGVLATYGILRELKTSREIAAIAALILASSPIYFVLSLTFMTDVPFTAFAIASIYFFIRGMRTESRDFGFYDRYVIIFIPVAIAIIAGIPSERSTSTVTSLATGIAILLVGVYAVFSVAATHDYLALNRMRWTAFHDLMGEESVSASRINGGRDFNGWYFYNKCSKDPKREWFWFERDDYLVAFNPFDDYEIIRRYPVERWLPWKRGAGAVLVERRTAGKSQSE